MGKPASDRQPTFEEALAELEAIVTAIEEGRIGLQEAIVEYEKGMKLVRYCRNILGEAEAKIQQLQVGVDGKLAAAPMSPPAQD
ncbi:MAG TPA: exodeoxyribonuclease VII small subunit [Phycisphaerae bacterium]|nr:exodeoxyribonuclease VII small subunit [Phycisphaerae bacterium]